jgi:arylsulfatase A
MNKNLIKLMTVLVTGTGAFCCSQQQKETIQIPQKPNIVLIVSDDMGWKDLSCYGNPVHETPNIDRFAEESVRFTNAYAAAPVCTPTRASIQTGKYPARLHMTVWSENARGIHGITKNQKLKPAASEPDLPLDEFTIAEALKSEGYNTAHIGKWHLGESEYYPENQGFDINIGGGSWGCPATFFYPYRGPFGGSYRYIPDLERSGPEDNRYFKDREGEFLTDRLTDEAIRIMGDGIHDGAPFFLNLNYYNVHTPIEAPDSLVDYYKDKIARSDSNRNPVYAAMVHIVDHNVKRILTAINDLGIADNTVVIFTSDNGGYIGIHRGMQVTDNSPLRSGKGSLYEGGIRIPLIIKYPGISQKGSVCDVPVITNDFYPTFCEIADIDLDVPDGLSLLPLLKNSDAGSERDILFWHYPHYYSVTTPVSAVRYKDWKLLKYYEDNSVELYNLAEDLGEKKNLSEERSDIKEMMLIKLEEWFGKTEANFPSQNPEYSSIE